METIALAVGLGLFQVGEFSFVLARVGLATESISSDLYALILATAILTMVLTPLVSGQTARLYALRKKWFRHEALESSNLPEHGLADHVVIAGGGRIGFQIAPVLERLNMPFVMVEIDHGRFERARKAGMAVVYGDAGQETVLEAAHVGKAALLIITIPDMVGVGSVVGQARRANPNIPVVARASGPNFLSDM